MGSKLSREEVYGYINTSGHCPEWVVDELLTELEEHRSRNTKDICIETKGGVISAGVETHEEFPGVLVSVNGITAAAVEYDAHEERVRVRSYTKDDGEPLHSYPWASGGKDDHID